MVVRLSPNGQDYEGFRWEWLLVTIADEAPFIALSF